MKRCSISLVIQNLHIKTTIKYHYIPIEMAKIQHTNKYKVPTRMWSSRNSHSFPVGMQNGAVQLLWKTGWQLLMKLNTVLPHGPTTVLPGIYPTDFKTNAHTKICIQMFISASFIISIDGKLSRCLS